MNNRKNR